MKFAIKSALNHDQIKIIWNITESFPVALVAFVCVCSFNQILMFSDLIFWFLLNDFWPTWTFSLFLAPSLVDDSQKNDLVKSSLVVDLTPITFVLKVPWSSWLEANNGVRSNASEMAFEAEIPMKKRKEEEEMNWIFLWSEKFGLGFCFSAWMHFVWR